MRRLFGTEREEVIGGLVKVPNEELYNSYSLPHITRIIKVCMIGSAGSTDGNEEKCVQNLVVDIYAPSLGNRTLHPVTQPMHCSVLTV
jgi:hypothetical protein